METIKDCIDAEINYRLSCILLDSLFFYGKIEKNIYSIEKERVRIKYNPPSRMLEVINDEKNNKDKCKNN